MISASLKPARGVHTGTERVAREVSREATSRSGKNQSQESSQGRIPPSLIREIAEALARDCRQRIEQNNALPLEPVAGLCTRFGASDKTVRRALRLLALQGIVTLHQGRRAVPVAQTTDPQLSPDTLLDQRIRQGIGSGEFSPGTSMPKLGYFGAEPGLSRQIVRRVYRALAASGVLQRRGNAYVVLPTGVGPQSRFRANEVPVIVICQPHMSSWRVLREMPLAADFWYAFTREALQQGVRLEGLAMGAGSQELGDPRAQAEALAKRICDLGSRYLGTLVVGYHEVCRGLSDAVRILSKYARPIVVFDRRMNLGELAVRSTMVRRCVVDEDSVCQCAVAFLANSGHRRIGYLRSNDTPWQLTREDSLRRACERRGGDIEFSADCAPERHWTDNGVASVEPALAWLHAEGPAHARAALDIFVKGRDSLLAKWGSRCPRSVRDSRMAGFFAVQAALRRQPPEPVDAGLKDSALMLGGIASLAPLAGMARCTAIIAPNDACAMSYHMHWIREYKLHLPRDISLLSIDNDPRGAASSLTTVDHGYGSLGYQAFHAILGAIAVKRDRSGCIRPVPRVVDRGSVGPARR